MKILRRILDILTYLAQHYEPKLSDLVNHFSKKWGVSRQTVYYVIDVLAKNKWIKLRRRSRSRVVDYTTELLTLINMIHDMIYGSRKWYCDRIRKLMERMEEK